MKAAIGVAILDWRIWTARRRESRLVSVAGAAVVESALPAVAADSGVEELRRRITSAVQEKAAVEKELGDSLNRARRDYARASSLMCWIIVARGVLDDWIVKDRRLYHRREHDRLTYELGLLVADGRHEHLRDAIPGPVLEGLAKTRADIESAGRCRADLVAPWNGHPLPRWLGAAVYGVFAFIPHLWKQLRGRIFLSMPALGAMAAGWWITHMYTDSTLERIQHSCNLGGRAYMDPHTLQRLKFWLPILAAAMCSFLVALITSRVRRKYEPPCGGKNG